MISDFILNALFSALNSLMSLMPTVTFDSTRAAEDTLKSVGAISRVIPILQLILAISACMSVKLALMGWDFIVWVYHQFWGSD